MGERGDSLCPTHADSPVRDVVACGQCAIALLKWWRRNDSESLEEAIEELDPGRPFPEELE